MWMISLERLQGAVTMISALEPAPPRCRQLCVSMFSPSTLISPVFASRYEQLPLRPVPLMASNSTE